MYKKGDQLLDKQWKWRGDDAIPDAKRNRAQRWFPLDGETCEHCHEAPAVDRHHIDGDVGNNVRENIAFLCRRCHMVIDGRMEKFVAAVGGRGRKQPPKPCIVCGTPYKPLRRGHCGRCYERHLRVRLP